MQNIISNKKIQKLNRFLISSEKKVFIFLGLTVALMLILQASIVFFSVSTAYNLNSSEQKLASIVSSNSILESEVSVKKEKSIKDFSKTLVAVKDVSYLDSSFERLAINK